MEKIWSIENNFWSFKIGERYPGAILRLLNAPMCVRLAQDRPTSLVQLSTCHDTRQRGEICEAERLRGARQRALLVASSEKLNRIDYKVPIVSTGSGDSNNYFFCLEAFYFLKFMRQKCHKTEFCGGHLGFLAAILD